MDIEPFKRGNYDQQQNSSKVTVNSQSNNAVAKDLDKKQECLREERFKVAREAFG